MGVLDQILVFITLLYELFSFGYNFFYKSFNSMKRAEKNTRTFLAAVLLGGLLCFTGCSSDEETLSEIAADVDLKTTDEHSLRKQKPD